MWGRQEEPSNNTMELTVAFNARSSLLYRYIICFVAEVSAVGPEDASHSRLNPLDHRPATPASDPLCVSAPPRLCVESFPTERRAAFFGGFA